MPGDTGENISNCKSKILLEFTVKLNSKKSLGCGIYFYTSADSQISLVVFFYGSGNVIMFLRGTHEKLYRELEVV